MEQERIRQEKMKAANRRGDLRCDDENEDFAEIYEE